VGEEVMHRIRRQIKKEGAKHVLLEVRPSNTAAWALYNKLGFQILGIRQGYYSNPTEDALVMGKNI
jgi:ribosomal-protein-alanine N-acetyltransferase